MNYRASICLLLFAITGCDANLEKVPDVAKNLVPTGYYCTATPSEAYSPGYVYRIDATGAELLVNLLTDQTNTFAFKAALGTYNASITRGAGLSISLLQPVSSISGGGDIGLDTNQISKISFSDGQYLLMTDTGANTIVERASTGIQPIAGSRYFVVRDVIQARGIDITLSAIDEKKLGGEVSIAALLKGGPRFSIQREESLSVSGTYENPLNVCIRAIELTLAPTPPDTPRVVSEKNEWKLDNTLVDGKNTNRIIHLQ